MDKPFLSACSAAIALPFTAMQAFALPGSLTHRWTFNSDDKDEITGAEPAANAKGRFLLMKWDEGTAYEAARIEIWTKPKSRGVMVIVS